jgi:glycosyltransferase involved in cell wall biosynthesis
VLAQTVGNVEIVVVDDGSTDGIEGVLGAYPGLTVVRQANAGVSAARNAGIARSSGEFLCFLDADDEWRPSHLEALLSLIEKYPLAEYFVTGHTEILPNGALRHSAAALQSHPEDFFCSDLLGLLNRTSYSVICTNSVCIRKEALFRYGLRFEPGAAIGEDTDLWYRLALRCPAVVAKQETTIYHRECSTATKESFYTRDWVFALRGEEIAGDDSIPPEIRRSAAEVLDRYKLESARRSALEGRRQTAKHILKTVTMKRGRRYTLTRIFCMLPRRICRILYRLR